MSKKPDLLAQLREQRQESLADVPPVLAKAAAQPPPMPPAVAPAVSDVADVAATPKQGKAKHARAKAAKPATVERERTSINLTSEAATALRQLQAFMMTEGGGGSAGAAMAINVALEFTAANLGGNKPKLADMTRAYREADRRRRPTK